MNRLTQFALNKGIDAFKGQLSNELKKYGIKKPAKIMESIVLEKYDMTSVSGKIDLIKLNENDGISKLLKESLSHFSPTLNIDDIIKKVVSKIMDLNDTAFTFNVKYGTSPQYDINFVNVATFNNSSYTINLGNIFSGIDDDDIPKILTMVKDSVSSMDLADNVKAKINEILDSVKIKDELNIFKNDIVSKSEEIDGTVETISSDIIETSNQIMGNQNKTTGGMTISQLGEKFSEAVPSVRAAVSEANGSAESGLVTYSSVTPAANVNDESTSVAPSGTITHGGDSTADKAIHASVTGGKGGEYICEQITEVIKQTKGDMVKQISLELQNGLKNDTEGSIKTVVAAQVREFAKSFAAEIGSLIYTTTTQNRETAQPIIEMVKNDISEGIRTMLAERTDNGLDAVYKSILADVKEQLYAELKKEQSKKGGKTTRKNRLRNRNRKTKKR